MIKAKLKDYIKDQIQEVRLPWKLGGIGAWPQEQNFDPIIGYNRLLNEEIVTQQIHKLERSFATNQITEYQSFLEYSLARNIRNEMQHKINIKVIRARLNHQNFKFDLQIQEIFDINLYNITNVFRVGIKTSRHANKQEKIAKFTMKIGDKDFMTFFNKRPQPKDKAVISMWFDVAFEAHVKTMVSGQNFQYENDEKEIHTFRYEIDIVSSEYKSVKLALSENHLFKDLKFNLQDASSFIVDIDNYADGNEFKKAIVI